MGRLIDADAAIDTLKELTANGTNKGMVFGEDAVHRIEILPSVQPEQRWIPVSERLPEPWDFVLVTDRRKDVRVCQMHHNSSDGWYDECDNWVYFSTSVIAWMPLPEPYQGKRKGADE